MAKELYALILAGGSGERFWPLSRRSFPKQLLRLVSERTLLEETILRLDGVIDPERVIVLTNVEQEAGVRGALKDLPKENIVAEPTKRDTAAAVALGTGLVAARDHDATMIVLPADHVIKDKAAFQKSIRTAVNAAEAQSALVTIGIKPTSAHPGFGYIEMGEARKTKGVYEVVRFREKPNVELAETFLRLGNFRWNAGMFIWRVRTIITEFNRYAREFGRFISSISSPGALEKPWQARFSKLPKISFDYAVMEHADRVLMVEADFDWDDVGGWQAVARYFEKDAAGNAATCHVTSIDAADNIVYSHDNTEIALLGVNNLIVVRTADAILVCHRHHAEKIKNLVGKLPEALQ
ncbi:MAG: mannose-1-phosphate guanylyltransferase [Verrucomicrobiota bacterium]|nr:mannose-1-phosphate guanylyltransferase [Verrucomicrobiota bacterium]